MIRTLRRKHGWLHLLILLAILTLFFFYLVPIAFENPTLHIFAGTVRPQGVPVIFVHGLGSAPVSFLEMQERLEADGLYVNGADHTSGVVCNYAKRHVAPTSFAVSFYQQQTGRPFSRLGQSLSRNIDTGNPGKALEQYASLLAKRIESAKKCAGAQQVDIVAYSMGGMVLRKTLQDHNITGLRNLVLLGVPQKEGLYGSKTLDISLGAEVELGDIQRSLDECKRASGKNILYSMILSRDLSIDCQVLEYGLLLRGGAADLQTGKYAVSTIGGLIDGQGDGLINLTAVQMRYATNKIVPCEHNALRSPSRCDEAYVAIKSLLAPGEEQEKMFIDRFFDFMLKTKLEIRKGILGS